MDGALDELEQKIREAERTIAGVQAKVEEKEEELKHAPANERIYVRQELVALRQELVALRQELPPLRQRLNDLTGASRGRVASAGGTWLRVAAVCMQPCLWLQCPP